MSTSRSNPGAAAADDGDRSFVRRHKWLLLGGAVLCCGVVAWIAWPKRLPPANADAVTLARFVATQQYEKLPESQKRPYMKSLRAGMEQVAAARQAGKISQKQYDAAYLNAWLERQYRNMQDYYEQPAAKREEFLIKEYSKKAKGTKQEMPKPSDEVEDEFLEDRVEKWPAEEKTRFEQYRQAVKKAKQTIASRPPAASGRDDSRQ